ncbi:leucine Rich repeat-containing domain protein [Ancylostoma duodenale]|uniref:Leucine Rich repeat-containing domain protein n=1 Tax=Ancylostoma duodenale TaxID=51022 RepID=A0A0C2H8J9_9BILA|nr:leucine Rich repeat-containing domain protein [Ancylostoma duodenale]
MRTRKRRRREKGLRNLDRLEIDRCILSSLPGALFSGLHQLYSLIIKNAKLPNIPDELFAHTPNLMTLDMTGNELRIEPYSLKSLGLPEELTDLSLRHNFITTIHYVPQSARNLRRMDLSGNMLDFISGSGSVNMLPPGLKQVDLSNNRIAFIQEGSLAHMEKLALLDLKGNQLTELKEGSVLGPKTRLRLFLEGNPFQCHCGLRWLLHAKEKTSPVVLDLPTLSCSMLLDENQRVNLTVADQLNQLICKYESVSFSHIPLKILWYAKSCGSTA